MHCADYSSVCVNVALVEDQCSAEYKDKSIFQTIKKMFQIELTHANLSVFIHFSAVNLCSLLFSLIHASIISQIMSLKSPSLTPSLSFYVVPPPFCSFFPNLLSVAILAHMVRSSSLIITPIISFSGDIVP